MNTLITACMEAETIREVKLICHINKDSLKKYPQLWQIAENACKRIRRIETEKAKSWKLTDKN